jgi:hypothetical protein
VNKNDADDGRTPGRCGVPSEELAADHRNATIPEYPSPNDSRSKMSSSNGAGDPCYRLKISRFVRASKTHQGLELTVPMAVRKDVANRSSLVDRYGVL